ncbi:peroxide stress protein YaaA [Natronospirillum operosum]|uniref:UPF0246 protein E4656_04725 n=1 Tax=Natronospirillum operosum TaxID=2759953 RepID=A0A4Z0WGP4_9GAMM|nr:peroxide stress protein YaaA [Natronospirillum operosum]TGG95718.1 peroxide stress protein YaaA [Natronospirillum operosum]
MLAVISPAKTLDYKTPTPPHEPTDPLFPQASAELVDVMRQYSPADLKSLMGISDKLAEQNAERFSAWQWPFPTGEARAAMFAFKGDVYAGLNAYELDQKAISYLQQHLRILSGLYGILRPQDQILPYRLEMGKKVPTEQGSDLYQFWGRRLAEHVRATLAEHKEPVLINLASNEYFRSIEPHLDGIQVITPVFKDWKNGKYKVISFYAKKARGLMVQYMARHRISDPEDLKNFNLEDYTYSPESSQEGGQWVFLRR